MGRVFLERRGGGVFARDDGLVESEEDGTEERGGLLVRVGLQLRLDIEDECRADGREQTSLRGRVRWAARANSKQPTKIRVVLRSSSYFLT